MSKRSGKVRRTERYRYEIADPGPALSALADAADAEKNARGTDEHEAAKSALRDARQAVADCCGTIVFRALAPHALEAFAQEEKEWVAANGDEPGSDAKPLSWGEESFEVRYLAACDTDPEHTAQWWANEFADSPEAESEWTPSDRAALLTHCYLVNRPRRTPDLDVLGKD